MFVTIDMAVTHGWRGPRAPGGDGADVVVEPLARLVAARAEAGGRVELARRKVAARDGEGLGRRGGLGSGRGSRRQGSVRVGGRAPVLTFKRLFQHFL